MQHPTSRPKTRSTQGTKVNALKKNLSQLPGGKYVKLMKQSTRRRHQANKGKSGLEAERVPALAALPSSRSKMKLLAVKRRETHFLSSEEKQKWIEYYVDRETTVAGKRVHEADSVIMQDLEHMRNVEKGRSTTTKPETKFQKMVNAIRDSLSDLASSEDEEDGDDEDDDEEDTKLGKLSGDEAPSWVMGTISKTVQHRMESVLQEEMSLDELTQPGWGDAANYYFERDMKYGMTELKVPAVMKPQTATTEARPSPTTFGELMQVLDIVPR